MIADAAECSAEAEERIEFERIIALDPAIFGKRNREKNAAGFDAKAYPVRTAAPFDPY
jgi:hypothetical protein